MAQEQIPLTAVIVDDGGYGMLRYDQAKAASETLYGVDLHTPDFAAGRRPHSAYAAETVDGLDDDVRRSPRPPTSPTRPPPCSSPRTPDPLVPPPNTSPNWYRKR